jgi:hypothetical protein
MKTEPRECDPLLLHTFAAGGDFMEVVYDVLLADKPVGAASVKKEGLYYVFNCQCLFSGEVLYTLAASCGEQTVNLGICVPVNNGFGLKTRVPIKRLGEGKMKIYAVPRHRELTGKFIPIRSEEPFAYIKFLHSAYLQIRDSQFGVVIPESLQ